MSTNDFLQMALYVVVLLAPAKPLSAYMAAVYEGRSVANRVFAPVERSLYRLLGMRADDEMGWKAYALAFLLSTPTGKAMAARRQ